MTEQQMLAPFTRRITRDGLDRVYESGLQAHLSDIFGGKMGSMYTMEQLDRVYCDGSEKAEANGGHHMDWIFDADKRNLRKDIEALQRHLAQYLAGDRMDKDSGAHPLAHVIGRCGIIMDVEMLRNELERVK